MPCVSFKSTSANAIEPLASSAVAEPRVAANSVMMPVAVVEPAVMVGASFTPVTVTTTFCVTVLLCPSSTVTT